MKMPPPLNAGEMQVIAAEVRLRGACKCRQNAGEGSTLDENIHIDHDSR
jgi:hypothetical protein